MRCAIYFYLSLLFFLPLSVASGSETITFPSEDGLLITADIHAPYKNDQTAMIVLFHQAGWSRGEYTEIAIWLNNLGYNCMAIDQRSGGSVGGSENETALRAIKANRPTDYIDALPDINAALAYARQHYGNAGVVAWGSSYSAALVLKIAGEKPELIDGVLAFSPGEYFKRSSGSATWIQEASRNITVPVFIASSRNEAKTWAAIYAAIKPGNKTAFIPETDGRHGSRALWEKYPDNAAYRDAVRAFLERYFPTGR